MSNVARKRLRDAFSLLETTWQKVARVGSVPDFKENPRITLGSFSSAGAQAGARGVQGTMGEEDVSTAR